MSWYDPTSWNWTGGKAGEGLDTKGAHYDQVSNYLSGGLKGLAGRQAPQAQAAQLGAAAQLNQGDSNQIRQQQLGLTQRLQQQATGQTAGAGELAVNRQVGQGLASLQANARMARGANTALAARQAARSSADMGLGGAGQAAMAQMNDQTNANQQLGGVLQGMRGQDIDIAGQNAGFNQQRTMMQGQFGQQTALANQAAQLQQQGMNDAQINSYLAKMMGMDDATFAREMQKKQLNAQDKGIMGSAMQIGGQALASYAGGGIGGMFGGGGASPAGYSNGQGSLYGMGGPMPQQQFSGAPMYGSPQQWQLPGNLS